MCTFSNHLLDLHTKIDRSLSVCHFKVLSVAACAARHCIQLLFCHDHYTPVLCWIECLQVVNNSTCSILCVALGTQRSNQELLAKFDKLIVHVHLLLNCEETHWLIWLRHTSARNGAFVDEELLFKTLQLTRIHFSANVA